MLLSQTANLEPAQLYRPVCVSVVGAKGQMGEEASVCVCVCAPIFMSHVTAKNTGWGSVIMGRSMHKIYDVWHHHSE